MFHAQLATAWRRCNSFLCVGIDPHPDLLPASVNSIDKDSVLQFCVSIVDEVHDLVCAFKPQIAHFSALACENELATLIAYIHERYPDIPVILDAKRGDIGTTAERYASEVFERYGADAATVNPFLGWDTIEPFLKYEDRGVSILCRTSNEGSSWLQSGNEETPLFLRIAMRVHEEKNQNISLVVGATHPEDLRRVRHVASETTFLVPGIGTQQGDVSQVLKRGTRHDGRGLVVNVSRSIIYASSGPDYLEKMQQATRRYSEALRINK